MENEEQNDFRLEGTGFAYTLSLINGKYKMPILYCLSVKVKSFAPRQIQRRLFAALVTLSRKVFRPWHKWF